MLTLFSQKEDKVLGNCLCLELGNINIGQEKIELLLDNKKAIRDAKGYLKEIL